MSFQDAYMPYGDAAALQYGVPSALEEALFQAESGWNPNAVNPGTGAMGMGQVLPSTAAQPGYGVPPLTNPYDPAANANFSMNYLSALKAKLGSWVAAVQAYYPNAATDPNYAATYAEAQAADAGSNAAIQGLEQAGAQTMEGGFGSAGSNMALNPATGQPQITNTLGGSLLPSWISQVSVVGFAERAALVILGGVLIAVGMMGLAFRTSAGEGIGVAVRGHIADKVSEPLRGMVGK